MDLDIDNGAPLPLARAHVPVSVDARAGEFRTGRRTYTQQFNQLYQARLDELKPHVRAEARRRWEGVAWTERVLNVDGPARTYVIGTLFVESPAKPSTLAQVEKTRWLSDAQPPERYRGVDGAEVHLEDESGRIRLVGAAVEAATLASGVVAAVLGCETPDGRFEVADVCFAGMPPQRARAASAADAFVALVAGLNVTAERPVTLEMQLLAELLCGSAGGAPDQALSAHVVQTLVVGPVVAMPPAPLGRTEDARANDRAPVQRLLDRVDAFLADVAAAMPLTLLPGRGDPTDASLPQQPLNPGMFPRCRRYSAFRTATNPTYLDVAGGTLLLAAAGQPVDDLARYATRGESPCALAAASLRWRHIAPSAPDTLWCYPFTDRDPFVVRESPHVYVVGGQPEFAVDCAQGPDGQQTRIVAVPDFSASHTAVLLNLRTLECRAVRIGAPAD
ncbi:DNA polymerase delta small subunit Cdc1 [Coemansia javaensis]|uniref:DNA polymerase delta small subunit Cdc1 n=1 Tax=Coemansia javaensis TaxID=2761396 RepID=A0A9W8LI97_9FUNG|nr:DNA polymerase delta small subunit Cdc1 [Coemansia javaensis]